MSRKTAREHAFRLLFSTQFQNESVDTMLERSLEANPGVEPEEKDLNFIRTEVAGTLQHQQEINKEIEGALQDWKLSRLSHVDLAILQITVYEMRYEEEIPVSVSINEAVELAKKYSSDAAPAFINGVLGTIAGRPEDEK